jgi:hypothetical protein
LREPNQVTDSEWNRFPNGFFYQHNQSLQCSKSFRQNESPSIASAGRAANPLRKFCATRFLLRNICAAHFPDCPLLLVIFTWHITCLGIKRGRVQRQGVPLQPTENKPNRTSTRA